MYRTVVMATAGPAIVGCSLLLDPNRTQCASNSDCVNRGPAFAATVCVDSFCQGSADPTWSCAGDPPSGDPDAGPGPFIASIILLDANQVPLAGVQAQPCSKLDVDCTTPLASPINSDANGLVSFAVPSGFDGYLQLTSSSMTSSPIVPTLYFFNPPIVSNTTSPLEVTVLVPEDLAGIGQEVGVTLLSDRGTVILTALDCQGNPAPGVVFSVSSGDSMTATFYTAQQTPLTDAGAQSTDTTGYAGIANVPAGSTAVTGTLLSNGERLGAISLFVRAGAISYAPWVPLGE